MSSLKLSSRYAKSLLDLAEEQHKLDRIHQDVALLSQVTKENRDFFLMLKSPLIKGDIKKKVIAQALGGQLDSLTMAFIDIMLLKKREFYLPEILHYFIELFNKKREITEVKIISASPLSAEIRETILQKLSSEAGLKTIHLTEEVKEELLGGFILRYDDRQLDAALASKLRKLRAEVLVNKYIYNIR